MAQWRCCLCRRIGSPERLCEVLSFSDSSHSGIEASRELRGTDASSVDSVTKYCISPLLSCFTFVLLGGLDFASLCDSREPGKGKPVCSRLLNPGSHLTGEKSVNRSFSPSSPRPGGSLLLAEDAGSDIVVDRLAIAIVRIAEAATTT